MSKRAYDVTRSYFDMARASTDTSLVISADAAKDETLTNNANLVLVSSSWMYSHMAITAFVSAHLHDLWCWENSPLKAEFPQHETFEAMMKCEFRDLKSALRKLAGILGIQPLHVGAPKAWQHLCEFVQDHRDFFVHPTPSRFPEVMERAGRHHRGFPCDVAIEVIGYFYDKVGQDRPVWLGSQGNLNIPSINVDVI